MTSLPSPAAGLLLRADLHTLRLCDEAEYVSCPSPPPLTRHGRAGAGTGGGESRDNEDCGEGTHVPPASCSGAELEQGSHGGV